MARQARINNGSGGREGEREREGRGMGEGGEREGEMEKGVHLLICAEKGRMNRNGSVPTTPPDPLPPCAVVVVVVASCERGLDQGAGKGPGKGKEEASAGSIDHNPRNFPSCESGLDQRSTCPSWPGP